MANETDIELMVKTTIQTQIVKAFNDAPDTIDKLVKAALSQPVDEHGRLKSDSWGVKQPYLDWLVGQTIRDAATVAVREVMQERHDSIQEIVRAKLSDNVLVDAMTKTLLGALANEYRVTIKFAEDK